MLSSRRIAGVARRGLFPIGTSLRANTFLDGTLGQGPKNESEDGKNPKAHARLPNRRVEVRPGKQPSNTRRDEGRQCQDSRKAFCQLAPLKGGTTRILTGFVHLKALVLLVASIGKVGRRHPVFFDFDFIRSLALRGFPLLILDRIPTASGRLGCGADRLPTASGRLGCGANGARSGSGTHPLFYKAATRRRRSAIRVKNRGIGSTRFRVEVCTGQDSLVSHSARRPIERDAGHAGYSRITGRRRRTAAGT